MPSCVVPTCKNSTGRKLSKKSDGITFHLFPADEERKSQWTKIIQKARLDEFWKPSKRSQICSIHFKDPYFYYTKCGLKRLKTEAFPSVNLALVFQTSPEISKPPIIKIESQPELPLQSNPDGDLSSDLDSVFDSPRRVKLKAQLRRKEKFCEQHVRKIKTLQQKTRRLAKKNKSLKSVLRNLKKNRFVKDDAYGLLSTENEDSLQSDNRNEIKVFCPKCNAEISHTAEGIQEDQTKIVIAKVYHYFEQEYEDLKKSFDDIELTPLSKFRQRTALATGVSEKTVEQILQEEARRNTEVREEPSQNESLARKRPRQTESSSDEDSENNEDGDDEQSSTVHEEEMLMVKEEPAEEPLESNNDETEIYVELSQVKDEPGGSGANDAPADPISIDIPTEPQNKEATSMPFKIVRTIEKGKPELFIVPSQWESGGILKWPKTGAAKLSQNQDTVPGSDWLEMNCSVQRRNIVSYEEAHEELQAMLDNNDTEKEDEQVTLPRSVQHREPVNLNVLSEHSEQEDCGNTSTAKIDCRNASEPQPGETCIILSDNSATRAATIPEQNSDIKNLLHNQSVLFNITNQIVENQNKIIHKLASISVQMEESFSKIENHNTKAATVSLKETSSAESDSFILKQIKNAKDLEEMEKLLSDKDYKKKLKNSCSFICSSGEGHGTNCAYRFLDVLFSREFLCECSWSGSSRDDCVKISLKCFKNTLNFFFEMINHWDTSYTQETNENFFKNVLKNAKKRKSVKYERIPTKRHRLKGMKSAKEQKTTDT